MNPQIEFFCTKAIKRGLLSECECFIVKEMCATEATLDDFVRVISQFGVATDPDGIKQLFDEIVSKWDGMSAEDRLMMTVEAATSERKQGDTRGLEWFCFFAISSGYLTKDICLSIASEIEDLSDVLLFAQAVVDHWQSSDYTKIQECLDKAIVVTQKSKSTPPFSLFGRTSKPVVEPPPVIEEPESLDKPAPPVHA